MVSPTQRFLSSHHTNLNHCQNPCLPTPKPAKNGPTQQNRDTKIEFTLIYSLVSQFKMARKTPFVSLNLLSVSNGGTSSLHSIIDNLKYCAVL